MEGPVRFRRRLGPFAVDGKDLLQVPGSSVERRVDPDASSLAADFNISPADPEGLFLARRELRGRGLQDFDFQASRLLVDGHEPCLDGSSLHYGTGEKDEDKQQTTHRADNFIRRA